MICKNDSAVNISSIILLKCSLARTLIPCNVDKIARIHELVNTLN